VVIAQRNGEREFELGAFRDIPEIYLMRKRRLKYIYNV
jgi:hypothetical protein